jgi:antitoxin VapB
MKRAERQPSSRNRARDDMDATPDAALPPEPQLAYHRANHPLEPIMALNIKDPQTELLARTLAERTGESVALATRRALEERLKRLGASARSKALVDEMEAIQKRLAALPVLDPRGPDEIMGYDEHGLPR